MQCSHRYLKLDVRVVGIENRDTNQNKVKEKSKGVKKGGKPSEEIIKEYLSDCIQMIELD